MAKKVTIKAPDKKHGIVEVSGYVVYLYVGQYRYKFLIQTERFECDTIIKYLTHYASGNIVNRLEYVPRGDKTQEDVDRDAAKNVIEKLIQKYGEKEVRRRMDGATVINN